MNNNLKKSQSQYMKEDLADNLSAAKNTSKLEGLLNRYDELLIGLNKYTVEIWNKADMLADMKDGNLELIPIDNRFIDSETSITDRLQTLNECLELWVNKLDTISNHLKQVV